VEEQIATNAAPDSSFMVAIKVLQIRLSNSLRVRMHSTQGEEMTVRMFTHVARATNTDTSPETNAGVPAFEDQQGHTQRAAGRLAC
jgi:hypothetical protein